MTFDDGILTVYTMQDVAENGGKPNYKPVYKASYYFCFDILGFSRYYTALQAKTQLSDVVNVPEWVDIAVSDTVRLEKGGVEYRIAQVQKMYDENGLKITKLSLERVVDA